MQTTTSRTQVPTGQTLLMRIQASGFIPNANVGYTLGENIAWGTLWLGTPRSIVKAWMESPGHRANILNGSYRYTGIGIDPEPARLDVQWTDGRDVHPRLRHDHLLRRVEQGLPP